MALTKYKLGELIEQVDERNSEGLYTLEDIKGISTEKSFIETKANLMGVSLDSYKVVHPKEFAYVSDTSRRGDKIALAYNDTEKGVLISSIYTTFKVIRPDLLLSDYLFMYFNRPEFDRYSRFNSWGSARETFDWSDFCDIDLLLPPIAVQRKYVEVYRMVQNNYRQYCSNLDDLKLTCDAYIENLRNNIPLQKIGEYIEEVDERNSDLSITLTQGVDVNLQFIPAKREAEDQGGTKIVRNGQFAFNKVVKSNGTKLPIALRDGEDCVISSSYEVFEIIDKDKLLPEYLMLWLSRPETHRHCGYLSFGTTRDVFPYEEFAKLEFPIPSIAIQQDIVNIYRCYIERQRIATDLKAMLNRLCPILIQGSIQSNS